MHVFGLTGGLASGKSTVAALFRGWGVAVVDADVVAREVVQRGTPALRELTEAFGDDILGPDGALERKALAKKAFATPDGRRRLGAITHPRIAARSQERFAELAAGGEPLVAYDAALLVENGLQDMFRPLIVVSAPLELQLARAVLRDNEPEADVKARLAAQMPLEKKVAVADFVVDNASTREALAARAAEVLRAVCEKVGVDASRYRLPAAPPG